MRPEPAPFYYCTNKFVITLVSNGRNVMHEMIPSFSTFYIFTLANSTCEANL
jgi:hypothetical protein